LLEDKSTKPLLIGALDLTPVERYSRAEQADGWAMTHHSQIHQTLAHVIRNLTAQNVVEIKSALAAQSTNRPSGE
jgi:hypothetical protein